MTDLLDIDALRKLPSDVMEVEQICVYFLWKDDELLYIGATTQACDRIARHIRDRNYRAVDMPFNRYTFLETPDRRRLWELEIAYQRKYDPPHNVVTHQKRRY